MYPFQVLKLRPLVRASSAARSAEGGTSETRRARGMLAAARILNRTPGLRQACERFGGGGDAIGTLLFFATAGGFVLADSPLVIFGGLGAWLVLHLLRRTARDAAREHFPSLGLPDRREIGPVRAALKERGVDALLDDMRTILGEERAVVALASLRAARVDPEFFLTSEGSELAGRLNEVALSLPTSELPSSRALPG